MVIQEPEPPPAPVEIVPEKTPAPEVKTKPKLVPRNEPPPAAAEEAQPTAPPSAEIPALEPRETSAQEAALRRNIQSLQEDIRQRLSRINEVNLSAADRRTLNDARNFFSQSGKAFDEGDLQRAQNLAQKASLLVRALEQVH
jgi:outer membrane biosynthesis protein TonB